LGADDVGLVPIAALDEHVRLDGVDEFERRLLVEKCHVVDHLECGQHLRALALAEDRSSGSFAEALDRPIAVQTDDQEVTEAARVAQRAHVSGMNQIEAPVRENHRSSAAPLFGEYPPQLGNTQDAAHVASLASRASSSDLF